MSMDYAAGFVVTIAQEHIEQLVPVQWKALREYMDEKEFTLYDLAYASYFSDVVEGLEEEDEAEAFRRLNAVTDAFLEETQLNVELGYYDEDSGSSYDELESVFWALNFYDVFQYTAPAQNLKANSIPIELKTFVSFG